MSDVWHYDTTPLPVGVPIQANGRGAYQLGLYDGADYGEQYADEPESGVVFLSPLGAKAWLEAATEALTSYIETGDREARVPDPDGWAEQ